MSPLLPVAVLTPLLSTFGYRRAGTRWTAAAGLGVLAVLLTAAGGAVAAVIYGFGMSIETGLCGTTPPLAVVAGSVVYVIVGSWASLSPRRVWAWALLVGAALAAGTLVAYWFDAAHHYCET